MKFDIRAVRERVSKKLQVIGRSDEDLIHAQYGTEIYKEFANLELQATAILSQVNDMQQGCIPSKGLLLVNVVRLEELKKSITGFIAGLK